MYISYLYIYIYICIVFICGSEGFVPGKRSIQCDLKKWGENVLCACDCDVRLLLVLFNILQIEYFSSLLANEAGQQYLPIYVFYSSMCGKPALLVAT